MSPTLLAVIFALLALLFPAITYICLLRSRAAGSQTKQGDGFAELKGSVLYLQTAFPTIFLILTALGFGSYPVVINKVTDNVREKFDRAKIDSLVSEIEALNKRAHKAAEPIFDMQQNQREFILKLADESFLKTLPKGTIIPYWGEENDIDFRYWAICDGQNGTPDLRDQFILGAQFDNYRRRGGDKKHSHSMILNPRSTVIGTRRT